MSKEFKSIEEWEKHYFPHGIPEVPATLQLRESDVEGRKLLEAAAYHLREHALEYGHPGQHSLIEKINAYLSK
jgi:hypothetical protein